MSSRKLRILHLEDLPSDAELVHRALVRGKLDFDIHLTDNKTGFLDALENYNPDIILSDHSLPSFNSIEAIKIVKDKGITIPFILITATISEEFAVEVMKEGAWDYILKDRLQRLPNAIQNAMDKYRIDTEHRRILDQIIANEALYKEAERIAHFGTWRSDLITGSTVMSDAAYRILGYEPGEINPDDNYFIESVHPEDLLHVQNIIGENILGSETTEMDFRMKSKDGNIRHIKSQFQIERDENGLALSIVGFNQDITKQKQTEARIIQSEAQYRHLFENNPMPMWVIDSSTYEILDVNEAALKHYGYTRDEFLSMSALQLRPDDEKERLLNLDLSMPYTHDGTKPWKHLKKDGSIIYVEVFAHSIDYNNRPARLFLANDVTEVKHAEAELNKSLRELEISHKTQTAILDALPANIALLNNQGVIVSVNNGWKLFAKENYLKSKNYAVGDNYIHVSELSSAQDREYGMNISSGIRGVLERRMDSFTMAYPCHSHHTEHWFRVQVTPINDKENGGAVVMHIDITDRKRAEIATNELNKQLQNSLSQLSDYKTALDQSSIVAITDRNGTITYANDNFCKISKYSRAELIGQDHRLVNSGHHPKSYIQTLWNTISAGRIWKGELKNRAKDGSIYWVDTTILPFIDEHGKPYQYMSIRSDITEKKKAEDDIILLNQTLEKKVAERTEQLVQSMKELESFSYSVSHDLRAPLRVINGYTRLFIDEYNGRIPPEAIDYISTINENANQMGQLIEDLLNLSRLGLEAIDKADVDMKTLVEVILYEYRMSKTNITAEINVDMLLPAQCSRNLMKQVWVNLITNAIKYSEKKSTPAISISSYMTDSENIYLIKDNGAGFDMKYSDKLFRVFQRLHNKQDFDGTGVGLALVHRIISRHGGHVWAEGKVDEGATFYFSLPR